MHSENIAIRISIHNSNAKNMYPCWRKTIDFDTTNLNMICIFVYVSYQTACEKHLHITKSLYSANICMHLLWLARGSVLWHGQNTWYVSFVYQQLIHIIDDMQPNTITILPVCFLVYIRWAIAMVKMDISNNNYASTQSHLIQHPHRIIRRRHRNKTIASRQKNAFEFHELKHILSHE